MSASKSRTRKDSHDRLKAFEQSEDMYDDVFDGPEDLPGVPCYKSRGAGDFLASFDHALALRDLDGAEGCLRSWLETAREEGERESELAAANEGMRFFRRQGQKAEAIGAARRAIELVDLLGLGDSVEAGTVLLDAAVVDQTFGYPEEALELYGRAEEIYGRFCTQDEVLWAGLYNDRGLAHVSLGNHAQAEKDFEKAIELASCHASALPEAAMSCLNLVDAIAACKEKPEEDGRVLANLQRAQDLLEAAFADIEEGRGAVSRGRYADVCEESATVFDFYGQRLYARTLTRRAQEFCAQA